MAKKKIAFHTLGCKLNFSETSTISRQFGDKSFDHVGFDDMADIYVINSCSVTSNAEKRCKGLIRKAIKKNPLASVAVVGCYSQINPEELKAIPGVALVLGSSAKFNLFEHIKNLSLPRQSGTENADTSHNYLSDEVPAPRSGNVMPEKTGGNTAKGPSTLSGPEPFIPSWSKDDRTRSFFKIQDGCDYFCTYCTIPLARGHSRSDSIENTLKTAADIARTNAKEIVLSGVNIGDFGKQHNETFAGLLTKLAMIDGIDRIRISSVEPDLLHDDIIRMVADTPRLMPHFHIPLQSGSDTVLQSMGRRYNTSLFAHRVETIRKFMPHACIAADVIVGFPTETDLLFRESMEFIRAMDISYAHVFTYSERDNTRALSLGNAVSHSERNIRSQQLHTLSEEKKTMFYLSNKGHLASVLWENDSQGGYMHGFTENYIKTKTPYQASLVNEIKLVKLNTLDNDGVYLINE